MGDGARRGRRRAGGRRSLPVSLVLASLLFTATVRADPTFPAQHTALAPAAGLQEWQSSPGGHWLVPMPEIAFAPVAPGLPAITVDPLRRYQRIAGFGGAFNERGWAALLALSPADRQGVLRALFDPVTGAGYSLARAPIG